MRRLYLFLFLLIAFNASLFAQGEVPLNEVVHFDCDTFDPATGAPSNADSTPTFNVYEESTDTAIVSGSMTVRSGHTGEYRGTFTASVANGFDVGKFYNAKCYATVGGLAGNYIAMQFRLRDDVDLITISNKLPSALVSGRIDASVGAYQTGMTPLQPTVAGRTLDVAATGEAGVDFSNINGTLDAAEIGTAAITAAKFATDAIDGNAIATSAVTEMQTGVYTIRKNQTLSNYHFKITNSDGTNATGLTSSTLTCKRGIDSGALATCNASAQSSITELSNGVYRINLQASDLNGDVIWIRIEPTDATKHVFEQFIYTQR